VSVTHEAVIRNPLMQGQVLEGVAIAAANTEVAHKLGRPLRGVIPYNLSADARIWRPTTSARPEQTVVLRASAAVTADLLVW
jgi:hypothetical protein